ncbi:class I SAM-dependent methyltransferase [Paenibacillus medicaginis]|uniref:Class I SAM-dependent methyltransferase n=1 Tax=Paenibacillus medicaginis TaxID=1470560 RepID=A0ABV5BZF3_9BACL
MGGLSFLKQYITKPRTVGALLPSSKYLASKMVDNIDFNQASYIVEYGPGTGVFTEKIIKNRKESTIVLLFESNKTFYNLLKEKFEHERNLHIINDSAEHLEKYMIKYEMPWVDYFISGLPFASLPQSVSSNILRLTQMHLRQGGSFITFQYTLLKKDLIGHYFNKINIKRELRNIPPAYVFCCSQ